MSTSQATLEARSGTERGPLGGSGGGTQGALPYTQAQAMRGEETRPWARTGLCGQLHAPHGPQKTRGRGHLSPTRPRSRCKVRRERSKSGQRTKWGAAIWEDWGLGKGSLGLG